MSDEALQIPCALEAGDYVEASVERQRRTEGDSLGRTAFRGLLLLAFVVTLWWPVAPGVWTAAAAALLLLLVFAGPGQRAILRLQFGSLAPPLRRYSIRWSDARLEHDGEAARHDYGWSVPDRWFETDRIVVLLRGGSILEMIPKRDASAEAVASLSSTLRAALGEPVGPRATGRDWLDLGAGVVVGALVAWRMVEALA